MSISSIPSELNPSPLQSIMVRFELMFSKTNPFGLTYLTKREFGALWNLHSLVKNNKSTFLKMSLNQDIKHSLIIVENWLAKLENLEWNDSVELINYNDRSEYVNFVYFQLTKSELDAIRTMFERRNFNGQGTDDIPW